MGPPAAPGEDGEMKAIGYAVVLFCAGSLLLPAGCGPVQRSATENEEALASLANLPVVTEDTLELKSLDFQFALPMGERGEGMRFHYVFRRPDQFALLIDTAKDGLPFCCMAEGKTLFADPIHEVIYACNSNKPPLIKAYMDGGKFVLFAGGGEGKNGHAIYLDFAEFLKNFKLEGTLQACMPDTEGGRGCWVVQIMKKGEAMATYRIGPDPACPIKSIVLGKEGGPALLSVHVNEPIPDEGLLLPDLDVLARYVKVDQGEPANLTEAMPVLQGMLMVLSAGMMPDKRAEFEKAVGQKIDWKAAEAFAAKAKEGMAEARRARAARAAAEKGRIAAAPEPSGSK
jgi:hypothetical protein